MELTKRLHEICDSSEGCEKLAEAVKQQIFTDECTYANIGRDLISAYLEKDVDRILCALCGWSMDSLVKMAFNEKK